MEPARPAATLILIRDRAGAPAELLMIRRADSMDFAGGAWVFPGGRVDPGDLELARGLPGEIDFEESAARIAAIRETIEETGLAVALAPHPPQAVIARLQRALLAGRSFAALLAEHALTIDPEALVPFARWLPPERMRRRFDTRFYLARAPEHADVRIDGGESVAMRWVAAADRLAEAPPIIFPTRCNLMRLASYPSLAEAVAAARALPVRTLATSVEEEDGVAYVRVPEGFGYPPIRWPIEGLRRE